MRLNSTTDDEGYIVIPDRKQPPHSEIRGMKCARCGMKFDYGVAYGYCCPHRDCPAGWGSS